MSTIASSEIGTALGDLLLCDDIVPGTTPSYEICKTIYLYHPIGQKMAESPVKMAQFMPREITIGEGPEDELKDAFEKQRLADGIDKTILNTAAQARVYGIASLALLMENTQPSDPLDVNKLSTSKVALNVLDPLNTAGSLVLNQNPNAMDFQKHGDIAVNGVRYHRSRTVTLMNEQPIYIAYNTAAFGFVGRSVYQRALYPLKSFIQTMIADDMVARKVGLIVATLKMAGSVINNIMKMAAAIKRTILKLGATDNVISIAEGESISSVDLTNIDGPLSVARKHILENIAAAGDMPAKLLNNETFAEGFGEGTEDAKAVAAYVDGIRTWLAPLYSFMDMVTQRRAWNEKFFKALVTKYPEMYKGVDYEEAFYSWTNSFKAEWPSLLREPESEQVRVADTKMKAAIAIVQVCVPEVDPEENKVRIFRWLEDQINNTPMLFSTPMELDFDALAAFKPPSAEPEIKEAPTPPPFSARDGAGNAIAAYLGVSPSDGSLPKRIARIEDYLHRKGVVS